MTDNRTKRAWPIYMRAPDGKRHRIHSTPNHDGFGAHAWAWCGFGRRIHQYAASEEGVVQNIVKRLKAEGWKEGF